jgi:hypothetical protein
MIINDIDSIINALHVHVLVHPAGRKVVLADIHGDFSTALDLTLQPVAGFALARDA